MPGGPERVVSFTVDDEGLHAEWHGDSTEMTVGRSTVNAAVDIYNAAMNLASDLERMHGEQAIDLGQWPAAARLPHRPRKGPAMIRETCSCGAKFKVVDENDDAEWQEAAAVKWRANHRHDVSKIEPSGHDYAGPITVDDDALLALVEQNRRAASTEQAKPPATSTDEPLVKGSENSAETTDEPPLGTPVWWDGKWWCKGSTSDSYYYEHANQVPKLWEFMPGAVAALPPEQVDARYEAGLTEGIRVGRLHAARDVQALMRGKGWGDQTHTLRELLSAARGEVSE
jgi:hypothetical protein